MTLPDLTTKFLRAWDRAKVQIPLAIECAYLFTLKHKCLVCFIAGIATARVVC